MLPDLYVTFSAFAYGKALIINYLTENFFANLLAVFSMVLTTKAHVGFQVLSY